jgi:hypothetical protein
LCFKAVFIDKDPSIVGQKTAAKQLEDFTKNILEKYFNIVRTVLSAKETSEIIPGIDLVHSDLMKINAKLPSFLGIKDRAASLINSTVQDQIENSFTDLQASATSIQLN